MPLLITVVHAATLEQSRHGGLPERLADERFKRYEIALLPLLDAICAGLLARGGRPHLIIPQIHRSRIDFNRGKPYQSGEQAYDDPRAEPIYDSFDQLVAATLGQALAQGQPGLLIDLHGCTTADADLFLGSLNGLTVAQRPGQPSAYETLRAAMSGRGWRVAPQVGAAETRYRGRADGVIGRHNLAPRGGASIQIEVSRYIRVDPALSARFGADLAAALSEAISTTA
jgi:N-formylglutamate amidohydrolase